MEDLRQRVKELEAQVASLLELVAVLQAENRIWLWVTGTAKERGLDVLEWITRAIAADLAGEPLNALS